MEDKEMRPTKYWMQNDKGQWWRNGLAKSHWNRTVVGCAIPLTLDRAGEISLSDKTRDKLVYILVSLTQKMFKDGYRIRDWNGEFTEFGDLRPDVAFGSDWPELGLPNGFNRLVIANALKSAGAYDSNLNHVYNDMIKEWHEGIGTSMEITGEVIHAIGHWKTNKPSYGDIGSFSLAALSFLLQEDRREYTKSVSRAMNGLWQFMRYERHPIFTFTYAGLVRRQEGKKRIPPIIQDLRDFPDVDMKKRMSGGKKETDKVQPLANRQVNSIYWKSSPFAVVIHPQSVITHKETGDEYVYSGVDYMLAYWMGLYFDLIPKN